MEIFAFAIMVLFILVAITFGIAHSKKVNQAWAAAAQEHGLRHIPGSFVSGPKLVGTIAGIRVVVDTFRRSSGKNSKSYTRYRVHFPRPIGLGLRLTQEGLFSGVSKFFGSQDIQLGDRIFDQTMLIQGTNEDAVRAFLTPARRMRIQRFMIRLPGSTIHDNSIEHVMRGMIVRPESLVRTIEWMVRLATHLTEDLEDDGQLQEAMRLQNEGDPAAALDVVDAIIVRKEDTAGQAGQARGVLGEAVEERRLQGELRYMAGARDLAHKSFRQAHSVDPDDKEVAEWLELTKPTQPAEANVDERVTSQRVPPLSSTIAGRRDDAKPVKRSMTDSQPDVASHTASDPIDTGLSQKQVCDDLFGDSTRSFDVSRRFESVYRGQRVRWQGELQKIERNYSDFIFDQSAGAKATLKIDERESPYFGMDAVLAVVHLPESAIQSLKPRIGTQLQFAGTLVKVDGLMKNIYLDHGELD
jgi:hypothetical protein